MVVQCSSVGSKGERISVAIQTAVQTGGGAHKVLLIHAVSQTTRASVENCSTDFVGRGLTHFPYAVFTVVGHMRCHNKIGGILERAWEGEEGNNI